MEISQLNEEKEAYEELKKEINKPLEIPEDKCNTFILYNIDNAKIILNLIEKQQKEIKELKEKEKNLLKQLKDSEKELLEVTQNVVSKDKIREKIKEYDKIRLETKDSDLYDIMQDYIAVLSGLLKEK